MSSTTRAEMAQLALADAPSESAAGLQKQRPSVLVVDDTPANLTLMAGLLKADYRVMLATSGAKALQLARRAPPDLVLVDVMMPEMDGYEVCRQLKADPATRDVAVIFLTALASQEDQSAAFAAGGADFIVKPFNPATLRARVRTHLSLKQTQDSLRAHVAGLSCELSEREREVEALRDGTLYLMVNMAEFRDNETGHHLRRTQEYVRTLAAWLAAQADAPPGLDAAAIEQMAKAAPLHDIGKVSTPDGILLKPGKLSPEEWVIMRQHTIAGSELLQRAIDRLGTAAGALLRYGQQIARHHHERWDGGGYPDGLAGEAIPLAARIMAVADVYDALRSVRPYKTAMSHEEAMRIVRDGAGGHFDPRLVEGIAACEAQFIRIEETWRD